MKNIAVLGGGNGAQALAGHLSSMGFPVTLFEHPEFYHSLQDLEGEKTIRLTGSVNALGKLDMVTKDPADIEDADIIYYLAPSFAQEAILTLAAPHMKSGALLILMPGNFGALAMKESLGDILPEDLTIAESDTIPYACRREGSGSIAVWGMKNFMAVSALPSRKTKSLIDRILEYFPVPLVPARNSLSIGLSNTNMILHCPAMIMNAGRIEAAEAPFRFYAEGMTDSVCAVMEAMDQERIDVGKALGLNLLSTMEDMKKLYSLRGANLRETILYNDAYCGHGPDSPSSMKHRYLTEDVPYLLVPTFQLGKRLGIPMPVMESVISLASVIAGEDYFSTGRTLKNFDPLTADI